MTKVFKILKYPVSSALALILLLLICKKTIGQELERDTILLKEVMINSGRISLPETKTLRNIDVIEISELTQYFDNDIATALKTSAPVDIRQRSYSKAQADINIRGGTFDQNVVLINGINLTDPQTGHHNLNIPIHLSDIDRVEVLIGPGARTFGANALTGAVNMITAVPKNNSFYLDLSFGSFNTKNASVSGSFVNDNITHFISANYSASDGFEYNTDYSLFSLFYENNIKIKSLSIKTMMGAYQNDFGALNFYSPQFADQFESIKNGFAALKLDWGADIKYSYNLYWKGKSDRFELFREDEKFYMQSDIGWINNYKQDTVGWYSGHNHHYTNIAGSGFNAEKKWSLGHSAIGADYRHELIFSNVLGNQLEKIFQDIYTKSDHRHNITLFAEHGYYNDKIIFNVGTMAFYNQNYKWNYYYGADLGYFVNKKLLLKTGINKSMRLPTFTDLYYEGPSNIGNPELVPEHAVNYEIGSKYYIDNKSFVSLTAFYRNGEDIISWVKEYNSNIWKTENLTELNTFGIETGINYGEFSESSGLKNLRISYIFMEQDKSAAGLESKYSLDQIKHKFTMSLNHNIYKNINGNLFLNFFKRNGEYNHFDMQERIFIGPREYQPAMLVNYSLSINYDYVQFYLKAYNITNRSYFDIGNVPTPGFHVGGGLKINLFGINFAEKDK